MKRGQIRDFYRAPEVCWVGEKQKVCYEDEEAAELAARYLEASQGLVRGALKVYRCEFGAHWHIANNQGGDNGSSRGGKKFIRSGGRQ
jgi:hypothetical protein